MATRRKKSIDDIRAQQQRITDAAYTRLSSYEFGSPEWSREYDKVRTRLSKAGRTADRYVSNIRASRQFGRDAAPASRLRNLQTNPLDQAAALGAAMGQATGRRYSQNTYIGLNVG